MVERSPYFCFRRGGWVPAITVRQPDGTVLHVEGPDAFTTWHEANEASRFLRVDGETVA